MKALILTAGLGTRLRPLTNERAKPSLPIVGVPTFWFSAWQLQKTLGIKEYALNLSHKPNSVKAAAEDAELVQTTGLRFHYSDETTQVLGSSGALVKLGASWIGTDTLAVCNGDSICFPDWVKMLDFHRRSKALITMHVRSFTNALEQYTNIDVGSDGRVRKFDAKSDRGTMFSGCYLFEPSLLQRLPSGVSQLLPSLLEPLTVEGKLYAYTENTEWFDTGSVATYAQTQFELLKKIHQARPLVEIKMRESSAECWVPRNWALATSKPALQGPVVITGPQAEWAGHASVFGPRFVGIESPPPGLKIPTQNAIVLGSQVERI